MRHDMRAFVDTGNSLTSSSFVSWLFKWFPSAAAPEHNTLICAHRMRNTWFAMQKKRLNLFSAAVTCAALLHRCFVFQYSNARFKLYTCPSKQSFYKQSHIKFHWWQSISSVWFLCRGTLVAVSINREGSALCQDTGFLRSFEPHYLCWKPWENTVSWP